MTETKGKRITKAVLEDAFEELLEEKAEVDGELADLREQKAQVDARLAQQGEQLVDALQRNAVLEQELGNGRLMELDVRRKLESTRTLVGMYQQRFGDLAAEGEGG